MHEWSDWDRRINARADFHNNPKAAPYEAAEEVSRPGQGPEPELHDGF